MTARSVDLFLDGEPVRAVEGETLLEVCRRHGKRVPTLCFLETLQPVNVCRVCVVEVEGARTLAPSCSRRVEAGMRVRTDSDRVRHSRKMVLEFLASSVDLSTAPELQALVREYGARPDRYGPPAAHGAPAAPGATATLAQPPLVDNDLYVRDYAKCVLCYRCVQACGPEHQNTFAIAVAGRGFEAHIATELHVPLPESACVYCGNCVAVCPTGALMAKTEHDLRREGGWDEARQRQVDTICGYCGVGCTLRLHVQDGRIVKVTSPLDHPVTRGNLCVKGRFGWTYVQER
ncbi:MAG TPA: 2Fe-2S iron-sulfur cluster-binding protein [Anaeromyxobacteraceae bacterium]|nr:2Fe-2S iron-sulfur cluster-binding protein [Anaeromyxobacteraceae bacterium]